MIVETLERRTFQLKTGDSDERILKMKVKNAWAGWLLVDVDAEQFEGIVIATFEKTVSKVKRRAPEAWKV